MINFIIDLIINYYYWFIYMVILAVFIYYSYFGLIKCLYQFGYEGDDSQLVGIIYISTAIGILVLTITGLVIIGGR